jgi:hypothetical protein
MLNLVEKFTPAVEVETDDAGLTTVEYAVAAAVVLAATGVAFGVIGDKVQAAIERLRDAIA